MINRTGARSNLWPGCACITRMMMRHDDEGFRTTNAGSLFGHKGLNLRDVCTRTYIYRRIAVIRDE